ncbi:MAG TPA: hypothetical protein VMT00_07170 [Thermoanaerobaculia bacterium]|nr:hypothetical protein [Thermoanaerobaculia bacterium]
MIEILVILGALALLGWLLLYMFAQRRESGSLELIQRGNYLEAMAEAQKEIASRPASPEPHLHRAVAAKLHGALEEALRSYRDVLRIDSDDAEAAEGTALCLTWLDRDLPEARRLMERTIQARPEIQEFQALVLAFILLRSGARDDAMRLFHDNQELLETRFEADYTDRDPLLAETLHLYGVMSEEAGKSDRAAKLYRQAAEWAPGSIFDRWSRERLQRLPTPTGQDPAALPPE